MKKFVEILGNAELTYGKLNGGREYVFLFLGAASEEAPLDTNLSLNALGWIFDPEAARAMVKAAKVGAA